MGKNLSVVMPVYNEAEIIGKVVTDFHSKIIKKMKNAELIVAEDGSTDGTREILRDLQKKIKFRLISTPTKKGYFRAAQDILKAATGKYILFTDSDNTHDPSDFWKMYRLIESCDVVIGYRLNRKDSIFRKLVTKIHNKVIVKTLFSVNFNDINCPFRLIRKDVIEDVVDDVKSLRYGFSTEFIIRASKKGHIIKEIPVRHFYRKTGKTFIKPTNLPSIIWRYFVDMMALKKDLS